MDQLFEYSDKLNHPYECFVFDSSIHSFPVHPHWHYFMELLYILDGEVLINCGMRTCTAKPGNLVIFPPSSIHSMYQTNDTKPVRYFVLKFDLGQLNHSISSAETGNINFVSLFSVTQAMHWPNLLFSGDFEESASENIQSIFEVCEREIQKHEYGYQSIVRSQICQLLILLLRRLRSLGVNTDCTFSSFSLDPSMETITEYIEQHIGEDLRVEELASLCHMSYSHFAKSFREHHGRSCKKYIDFLRLCKVENMLLFTGFDLNYISQETGFSDCSHLIHAFKKQYRMTPHQYRLKHRN